MSEKNRGEVICVSIYLHKRMRKAKNEKILSLRNLDSTDCTLNWPCWLSCCVLLLHCDSPTMATILAPKLERRFLLPARDAESGPPLLGLFSRLYMAPEMLEDRTTFRAAALSPLRPLIPPGLGTSTELLSIMVPLDWRTDGLGGGCEVGAGLRKGDKREKQGKVRKTRRLEVGGVEQHKWKDDKIQCNSLS